MTIAPVSTVPVVQGSSGGTSSAIDTTGANFLVCVIAYNNGSTPVISDSKSNAWSGLTAQVHGPDNRIFYAKNATVGSGHTFTVSGSSIFCSALFAAFSGVDTSAPADQENGSQGTAYDDSIAKPGPITPSVNGCLVIAGRADPNATPTTPSGYTELAEMAFIGGTAFPGGGIYQIQTTATTTDPLWTFGIGTFGAAFTIASFKPAAGAAAASEPPGIWTPPLWRRALGRR